MRVAFVDPGPHVGVSFWSNDGGFDTHTAYERTPDEFMVEVEEWVRWADVVGVEGFRIGGKRGGEANVTIEMIGVVRYLCAREGKEMVVQEPGAYRFAGSDKLKRLGWYTVGSDHARSASGHLVKLLADRSLIDLARLLPSTEEVGK